jgi:3-hydroxybutyryl-CoA dehydrogenase
MPRWSLPIGETPAVQTGTLPSVADSASVTAPPGECNQNGVHPGLRRLSRGNRQKKRMTMAAERIAVIGAGTMGRGIAQVCATYDLETVLHDVSEEALSTAIESIHAGVEKGIERGKVPVEAREIVRERLSVSDSLDDAVANATLVIEAAPEILTLKQELFRHVEGIVGESCLLGTNTSSLPITGIGAALGFPGRVIGLHFFNPVPAMALVEIVRGLETTEEAVERSVSFTRAIGKEPIVVKDSPGFATSRLGVAIGLEAIRMLEAGVASAEEIDRAMELGYRHPMGPLRLTDLVGLDVRLAIAEHLHREIGEQFRPPPLLRTMVRAGRLGKKSGRGFYEWS